MDVGLGLKVGKVLPVVSIEHCSIILSLSKLALHKRRVVNIPLSSKGGMFKEVFLLSNL